VISVVYPNVHSATGLIARTAKLVKRPPANAPAAVNMKDASSPFSESRTNRTRLTAMKRFYDCPRILADFPQKASSTSGMLLQALDALNIFIFAHYDQKITVFDHKIRRRNQNKVLRYEFLDGNDVNAILGPQVKLF
jgi:hypothetical protein